MCKHDDWEEAVDWLPRVQAELRRGLLYIGAAFALGVTWGALAAVAYFLGATC